MHIFFDLKFNFDRDVPFKQADFGDDFLRQIVGDRDQQKQQLARIEVSKADESKLGKNQFSHQPKALFCWHNIRLQPIIKNKNLVIHQTKYH